MRQPTSPKDSYRHSFPRREGRSHRSSDISWRTLLQGNKLFLWKNLESFVLHRIIRGAFWRGRRLEGRSRKKRKWQSENEMWGLQEDATDVNSDWRRRVFRRRVPAKLTGRRSPSPPQSCWPCGGWSGSRPRCACWCLGGETKSRRQEDTLCEKHWTHRRGDNTTTTTPSPHRVAQLILGRFFLSFNF